MPYSWEGMHPRLQWLIHPQAHGLREGDEHPAYSSWGAHYKPGQHGFSLENKN